MRLILILCIWTKDRDKSHFILGYYILRWRQQSISEIQLHRPFYFALNCIKDTNHRWLLLTSHHRDAVIESRNVCYFQGRQQQATCTNHKSSYNCHNNCHHHYLSHQDKIIETNHTVTRTTGVQSSSTILRLFLGKPRGFHQVIPLSPS